MRWVFRAVLAFLTLAFLLWLLVYTLFPDEFETTAGWTPPPTELSGTTSTSSTTTSTTISSETTTSSTSTSDDSSLTVEEQAPTETTIEAVIERSTATLIPYESPPPAQSEPDSTESPESTSASEDDFWYRLATCESENGRTSDNQFQFMGGTGEKVGYYPGASYEEQKAMAQGWAARLRAEGTHPGSSAGWPVCWWIAEGG